MGSALFKLWLNHRDHLCQAIGLWFAIRLTFRAAVARKDPPGNLYAALRQLPQPDFHRQTDDYFKAHHHF